MDHAQFTLVKGDIRYRSWFVGFPHPIVYFASGVVVRPSIYDQLLYADVNLMGMVFSSGIRSRTRNLVFCVCLLLRVWEE